MQNKIEEILERKKFDIIYADGAMAQYVTSVDLPKIVDPHDAVSESYYQLFQKKKSYIKKIFWLLQHKKMRRYEKNVFNKFNSCVITSKYDKCILKQYLPTLKIFVVPNGVDINYFKPTNNRVKSDSLIFIGDMRNQPNILAVQFFYYHIYPLIKKKLKNANLWIVGREPTKEIVKIASDESVVVTGYVTDVRPYLAQTCVIIIPMISGIGIKNKILEGMAMAKPIVSTSIGARGINVSAEENIIIANDPIDFAHRVVEIMGNEQMRHRLGNSGRELVVTEYSWDKMTNLLNSVLNASKTK